MTSSWRCFVSVPIRDALRRKVEAASEAWRARPDLAGLRWSDATAWHLTLAFLGDTDPAAIEDMTERLASAAVRHTRFRLPTGGLGGFPSNARARVAWYGIDDPDGRLRRLADDVGRAVDLEPDREFTAHLTLARAGRERIDLRPWIGEAGSPSGTLDVAAVELMRSHPGRGSSRYETLAAVPLAAARAKRRA